MAPKFPTLCCMCHIKSLLFFLIYFFIQQVLISHPFYTHQCIHVNPNLPIHPTATPPPTTFPPWCPYVCSLHLCLNFCPANRFICTIFLGSTYMREYMIFVFLFLTSLCMTVSWFVLFTWLWLTGIFIFHLLSKLYRSASKFTNV